MTKYISIGALFMGKESGKVIFFFFRDSMVEKSENMVLEMSAE